MPRRPRPARVLLAGRLAQGVDLTPGEPLMLGIEMIGGGGMVMAQFHVVEVLEHRTRDGVRRQVVLEEAD